MRLPENFDGLAFDIGGGDFDHHQNGAPVRENGVPYAAFGLLWRAFGDRLIPDAEEAARFDQHFIQPLDLDDNTGCGSETAGLIALFNPGWDSGEPADRCFWEAVSFAQVILEKRLESVRSMCRARSYVEEAVWSVALSHWNGLRRGKQCCPLLMHSLSYIPHSAVDSARRVYRLTMRLMRSRSLSLLIGPAAARRSCQNCLVSRHCAFVTTTVF